MLLSICDNPTILEVMRVIKIFVRIITIVVPIILIVSSMIMLVREMTGGKDDLLSNSLKIFVTKLIAAILVFLIPTFVSILSNITLGSSEYKNCLNMSNVEGINNAKISNARNLIKTANETLNKSDYQISLSEVNKISDSSEKEKLLDELSKILEQIEIKEKIEKLIVTGTSESYNEAVELVKSISNENIKKNLEKQLGDLKNKLEKNGTSSSNGGNNNSGDINVSGSSNKLEMYFIGSNYYDDAILIKTDSNVIMIDGGRYNASKTVTPFLQKIGISKIDLMIGSHLHFNHIQAQADILNNFNVSNVTYPDDIFTCANRGSCNSKDQEYILDALRKKNITPKITIPGDIINIGDMTLYFMEPVNIQTTGSYPQNANSSIFILKYKNNSFMFTGDISLRSSQIGHIKDYASKLGISTDVDVLKCPHHGNTTISDALLDTIKPEYIIVPDNNKPDQLTSDNINRLNNHGVKIFKQSDSSTGHIYLQTDGTKINIQTNYQ